MRKEIMMELVKVFMTIVGLVIFLLLFMAAEVKTYAATTDKADKKSNYQIVVEGIEEDIKSEEDEGKIISVERKEFPSEKVMMYEIYVECDGEIVKEFIYINGESEEVYALLYDSDNYVIDSNIMNLAEAAETYSE